MNLDTSMLVNNRWRIESKLGSGATGVIYSATDVHSGEIVAVKLEHRIETFLRKERGIYERLGCFDRASSRTFGLPFIYFYGQYGPDHYALVMDCLGSSFETDLQSDRLISQETSSRLAVQALDTLQYVHSEGVIHGDIWPANMLRGRVDEKALYLVDFGISETRESVPLLEFEDRRIGDLKDLGKALFELRTGDEYRDKTNSSGVVPELDRYFEMLESNEVRNTINYRSLRGIFCALLGI